MSLRKVFQDLKIPYIILGVSVFCVLTSLSWLLLVDRTNGIHDLDAMANMITTLEGNLRFLEAYMVSKDLRWKGMKEMAEFHVEEIRRITVSIIRCKERTAEAKIEVDRINSIFGEDWHTVFSKYSACTLDREKMAKQHEKERRELEKQLEYYDALKALGITNQSNCSSQITSSRDRTLEDIYKVLGSEALIALYKEDADLGSYLPQIKTLAEKRKD